MKEGWEYKKLGELGTFQRGGGFLKSDYVDNGFPCIHYGQIHTKFGVSVDRHLTSISKEKAHKSKIASKGDIIIAITSEDVEGSCKCTAWMGNYDVAVGAHTAIFKHNQNPLYISYVLRSKRFNEDKTKYAHGFKVVEIKPDDISKIAIPVAPISIQEYIVSELDLLSGVIEKQKAQLEELDKLAQSIFYDMFGDPVTNEKGWKNISLGDVVEISSKLVDPNEEPYSNLYHVSPANIISGTGEILDCKLAKDEYLLSGKYAFKKGVVLYSKIRPNLNKVAVPNFDGICSADMYPLTVKDRAINLYIQKLLSSKEFLKYAINCSGRARMPKINREALFGFKFCCPPLSLQQEFAAKVEAIEAMKAKVRQSLKEAETLFNERMDYYFN